MAKSVGMRPSVNAYEDFTNDLGWIDPRLLYEIIKHVGVYVYDVETTGLDPRKDRLDGLAFYVPAGIPKDFGALGYYDGKPIRAWFCFNDFSFMCHIFVRDIPGLEPKLAPIGVNMDEIYRTAKGKKPGDLILVNLRPPMDQDATMEALRPIWTDLTEVVGITHHGKFDTGFLWVCPGTKHPIRVKNIWADSMLADFCTDERRKKYGLKVRIKQEFNHQMTPYAEAVRGQSLLAFCNAKPLGVYAMDDCFWEWRLHEKSIEHLRQQEPPPTKRTELTWSIEKRFGRPMGRLERVYWGIDTRISEIIMEMQNAGVLIDWQWLKEVNVKIEKQKEEIAKRIEDFLKWPLNPNATTQVADALFAAPPDGLGLPQKGIPIGKTGIPSTSDKVIKHFARFHPLVADIIKWRSLDTIQGGFVKKLIKLAMESPDGRVYASFNQTRTVIARLSSSDPINFQNQPREKNLVRKAYCAHREGILTDDQDMVFLGGDYGQIELRVAAHLSKEENMLEVYRMGGICKSENGQSCDRYKVWTCEDGKCGHSWTPELWTAPNKSHNCPKCGSNKKTEHQARCRHVDLHQRTAEDANVKRNPLAKNCNFGLLYRMGAPKFCIYADLFDSDGMPMIDFAKEIIERWHTAYPTIALFHEITEFELQKNGWISKTLFGRRRRLDQEARINRFRAVTQGIQFQVSGTAQDIMKTGMIRTWEAREQKIANSQPAERALWEKFRFLMQIHDECIWQIPRQIADEAKVMVKGCMEGVGKGSLLLPLAFDTKIGRCWDDIH
jgi:DNA polymerase I-like protein with 3'-5' exonuclease and polymerase domains